MKQIAANVYVKSVSEKGITYTDEFKRLFITENEKGKLPRQIFVDCGFDIDIIGIDRVRSAGKRWRSGYRKDGILGLRDTREGNSGRSSNRELSLAGKYERLQAQNNFLKAEIELLKKLDMAERMMKNKSKY